VLAPGPTLTAVAFGTLRLRVDETLLYRAPKQSPPLSA
jgi:hypothetical protein